MVIYKEWVDFVIYTANSRDTQTFTQRLDTSKAVDLDSIDPKDTDAITKAVALARERGAIVSKSSVVTGDDQFEAIEITNYGDVTIWTKQKVWRLHKLRGYECLYEKLLFSPRHPPEK